MREICICGEPLEIIETDEGKIEKQRVHGKVEQIMITKRSVCKKCERIYTSATVLKKGAGR